MIYSTFIIFTGKPLKQDYKSLYDFESVVQVFSKNNEIKTYDTFLNLLIDSKISSTDFDNILAHDIWYIYRKKFDSMESRTTESVEEISKELISDFLKSDESINILKNEIEVRELKDEIKKLQNQLMLKLSELKENSSLKDVKDVLLKILKDL